MIPGVSPDQIREWKQQYGSVFTANIRGVHYVFRDLTFAEYEDVISTNTDSATAEDSLVELALLHPDGAEFDRIPAGVVTALAEEILDSSGFGEPAKAKEILEARREDVNQFKGLMKAFVLATMPTYKEEELEHLTFNEMARKVALAEQIIRVNQAAFGVDNEIKLDLIDPEEEAEKEQVEATKHAAQKKPGQAGYSDPIADKLHNALRG